MFIFLLKYPGFAILKVKNVVLEVSYYRYWKVILNVHKLSRLKSACY